MSTPPFMEGRVDVTNTGVSAFNDSTYHAIVLFKDHFDSNIEKFVLNFFERWSTMWVSLRCSFELLVS